MLADQTIQQYHQCTVIGMADLPIKGRDDAVESEQKATGACSRCGTFGCGNCLSARGNDWLCADCLGRVGQLPWDERESLGMWRAWWRTSVLIISSPGQALSTAEPDAPLGSSLLFVLLSTVVGYGPSMFGYLVALVPMLLLSAKKGSPAEGLWVVPLGTLVWAVFLLALQVGLSLFLSALDHLGLMLLGARPKSYSVTVRAYALSMGPYLLGLLPLCSLYVFPLWSVVLRIIANMSLHKTTAGKATAAVLLPIFLLCGGLVAFYAAVFALAANIGR